MEIPKDERINKSHSNPTIVSGERQKYKTITDLIQIQIKNHSEKPFLGTKIGNSYKWLTYKQVHDTILKLKNYFEFLLSEKSNFFTTINCNQKEYKMIGIFTNPKPESLIFMLTLHVLRITILPIFNTIRENNLKFILIHSEVRTLIVDENCLQFMMDKQIFETEENSGLLKNIILIDTKGNGMSEIFPKETNDNDNIGKILDYEKIKLYLEKLGIDLILLSEIFNLNCLDGKIRNQIDIKSFNDQNDSLEEKLEDYIILLNYTTSENTSKSETYEYSNTNLNSCSKPNLKGILNPEKSFISTLNSLLDQKSYDFYKSDTYYSFTSTADIPEYLNNLIAMTCGIKIGYYSSQPSQLFDDLKTLQPSILYLYPRVLSKISEALQSTIGKLHDAKKNLINNAIKIKINCLVDHGEIDHHIWDKLLFKKIKDSMGGNIRMIIVGGGHLSPFVLQFLKICLNTSVIEIYGVTESCGIISLSNINSYDNKFIGESIDSVEINLIKDKKLGEWDPHSYRPSNFYMKKCGEICIKGNLFYGYYKSVSREESIDEDGYFHTGDYGVLYEDINDNSQNLKLVDKLDDIMKTPAGFLISPSLLEELYTQSEYISNICIVQDEKLNLVAMVVLNKDKIYSMSNEGYLNFSRDISNSLEKIEEQTKQRKGSMNIKYKAEKSRARISKSIYFNNSNTKSLLDSSTPTHSSHTTNNKNCEEILSNPNVNEQLKTEILNSFKLIWVDNKLRNYESIDNIYILGNSCTPKIENGLLNCRMKLSRENMKKIYVNYLKKLNEKEKY